MKARNKWENILNIERKLLLTEKYLCSKDYLSRFLKEGQTDPLVYENLEMIFLHCIRIVNKQVKENKKNHSFPPLLKDPTNKANEK